MNRLIQCGLMLAVSAGLTTTALAVPVQLDTEQKANMAAGMALRAQSTLPREYSYLVNSARGIAYETLRKLDAETTPADVLAAPAGLTFPCATSGTLRARLSSKLPRVLRLAWQSCQFDDINGFVLQRDGSIEVTLFEDTFAPHRVAAVKLGSRDADFTETRYIVYDDQITDEKRSWNIRLRGDIPMTRAFPPYGQYIGTFDFETTGFELYQSITELPGTGLPLIRSESSVTAENLRASGSLGYDASGNVMSSDLKLRWGDLRLASSQDGNGASHAFSPTNLHIQVREDWPAFRREARFDGAVAVQNPVGPYTTGCGDGIYTFKTAVPLAGPYNDSGQYESGEFTVNKARVNFYSAATVPPSLPLPQQGLLTRLKVPDLGVFLYDSPTAAILSQNSQCQW